jgi:hypothetical protein
MSIDLLLYCKKVPKISEIEEVIIPLGFKIDEETSSEEYPQYLWFEEKDLASLRGCWLSWYKGKIREAPRGTLTVFIAKTYAGRSHEDLDMQNKVIKELKKRFGGSVYNGETGKYCYLRNDIPKLSYPEKRCGLAYNRMKENIGRIKLVARETPAETKPILGFDILSFNENVIINNLLVPFLVSSLEDFLRSFFISYLESQSDVLELVYEQKGKLEYATVRDLLQGKVTLAECEANSYSFQNLSSANSAFQQYVKVSLYNIWNRRKKYDGRFYKVLEVLQELLSFRHRIVHEAYIKSNLNKNDVVRYTKFVEYAGELLAQYLEENRKFRIDLEKYV